MFILNVKLSFLVIHTQVETVSIPIVYNEEFSQQFVPVCKLHFTNAVIHELAAKYYTHSRFLHAVSNTFNDSPLASRDEGK